MRVSESLHKELNTVRRILCLICFGLLAAACTPATVATPVVIQYTSAAPAVVSPAATPTGPTPTPTHTSTPYLRPTDDLTLQLDTPLVRVGDETITLADYRKRVRYERFSALESAERFINRVGLAKLQFNQVGLNGQNNPTAEQVAAVFNTLSNSSAFGRQIYDVMVRESIIRQEYNSRGLKLDPVDVRGWWIRRLDLQKAENLDAVLPKTQDAYIERAISYSGLSREQIEQIAESQLIGDKLRKVIAKENVAPPTIVEFKLKHILVKTEADATSAIAELKQGTDFRAVACKYSIDPGTRGNAGALGFVTSGASLSGVQNKETIFKASVGDVVGPLQSPLGWHLYKVNAQRKNADGDTQVDLQQVLVSSESLANEVKAKTQQGQDFAMLACQYSLDSQTAGNGGDMGWMNPNTLAPEIAQKLKSSDISGLIGPFNTAQGFEILSVDDRRVNVPGPGDLEKAEDQAYVDWQSKKASSSFVATLSDAWKNAIPTDPLPRDVSPLMREENFGLPTPRPAVTATVAATVEVTTEASITATKKP
jgi:parvulin-like peptidyl-prolyl isomerase